MAIYKQFFPTKWPLFELHFQVWKLRIGTQLMMESPEPMTYEYLRVGIFWEGELIYHFRLFDTRIRVQSRLDGMLEQSEPMTLKRLKDIRRIVNEEIKKLK